MQKRYANTYSEPYLIRLGGPEKLHPFDTHKYLRIHGGVLRDGLADPRTGMALEQIRRPIRIGLSGLPERNSGFDWNE